MIDIQNLRKDYQKNFLSESEIHPNPFEQFNFWLGEALRTDCLEPYAMTLATVGADQRPSSRVVLLRHIEEDMFKFFTNFNSRKGREIADDSFVALLFFWPELERQVRIEGTAKKLSTKDSDRYFESRPRASQIAAASSPQSEGIASRAELEKSYAEAEKKFADKVVIRPDHWGGYGVSPLSFEFWQGRQARLHDRIVYSKIVQENSASWKIKRLAP